MKFQYENPGAETVSYGIPVKHGDCVDFVQAFGERAEHFIAKAVKNPFWVPVYDSEPPETQPTKRKYNRKVSNGDAG
jgi:hypothetical protein